MNRLATNSGATPVKFTDSRASVSLDWMRTIAALLVLLGHWKLMFFVDYPRIELHRSWFAVPYVLASAAHQAVLIFFVLSGYLVSGSVFRALRNGYWSWRQYLTHRLVRLYVVLIPGMLLCALWDWIGLHTTHFPSLYNGVSPKAHGISVLHSFSLTGFAGNLAFVQTILVPTFGSDTALWSLANEFWYYMLFPLGLLAIRRGTSITARLISATLFVAAVWFVRGDILKLFPVWLAGSLLALMPVLRVGVGVRRVATLIYVPLVFVFAKRPMFSDQAQDYLFGVMTFLYLWTLLSARESAGDTKSVRLARTGASITYTLYIVHMPALLLLTAWIIGDQLWQPTSVFQEAIALGVLAGLCAFAYGIAYFTELRTAQIRRWVEFQWDKGSRSGE